jgi:hypothetical protein
MTIQPATSFYVAPGDLAFLLTECPRCFYDKVRRNIRRPGIFPSFFNVVDRAMKARYGDGKWHRLTDVARLTPHGLQRSGEAIRFRVIAQDGRVTSAPMELGVEAALSIRGVFDTIVEIQDGPLAICDFKTTFPKFEHLWFYRRPLHAYAYACEHPSATSRHRYDVPRLGLLVFAGIEFASNPDYGGVCGPLTWIELQRSDERFLRFMRGAVDLLSLPQPPPADGGCSFCAYRRNELECAG